MQACEAVDSEEAAEAPETAECPLPVGQLRMNFQPPAPNQQPAAVNQTPTGRRSRVNVKKSVQTYE